MPSRASPRSGMGRPPASAGRRHRRGHDLRRTMISLARTNGARKDILYTTFSWDALCAEVAKLKVQRHERRQLVRLPLTASAEKESPEAPDGARGSLLLGGGGNRTRIKAEAKP